MDLDTIKKEVVYSGSQSRLFEITIELTEELSKLHVELVEKTDNVARAGLKGRISLFTTLQNIIDKRIEDLRTVEKENKRKELLLNRQFKIASEMVLTKETYGRITELSLINYKELKEQKVELRANKLE
jgi:hypothetical protein